MSFSFSGFLRDIFSAGAPADQDPLSARYNRSRPPAVRHTFCLAPGLNMLFAIDGTVKACTFNHENSLGRYPDQSIKEIWEGSTAQQFRQMMAGYESLSGCSVCTTDYQLGNVDQIHSRTFDEFAPATRYPKMMEFLFSNTCNLECQMCTGELSSSIRRNRDKLPPMKSYYDDEFVRQLDEFIPHLRETRFSGAGEAFAIDMNYAIWDKLIARNPTCMITVQTNGTILNARVKDYLQRGNFKIGVSLDSLHKATFESIRKNATLEPVIEHIYHFAAYSREKGNTMSIAMCVMRENWHEMPAFVLFCNNIGANVTFHKVWAPLKYAIHTLPSAELDEMVIELKRFACPAATPLERRNKNHYEYYLAQIERWRTEAAGREAAPVDLSAYSIDELLSYAKSRLQRYIEQQHMLETDKAELIHTCLTKLDGVMKQWQDENEARHILTQLSQIKESLILPSLKSETVEKLYEMSKASARI